MIQIFSDLHTEFSAFTPSIAGGVDAVVLAGDIGSHPRMLHRWAALCESSGADLVFVAGNHEFYGRHHERALLQLREEAEAVCGPMAGRVHVLEHDAVVIGGVRFLGATAWTDFTACGDAPERVAEAMFEARLCMADFGEILVGPVQRIWGGRAQARMTPEHQAALSRAARAWFTERLLEAFEGPMVVVTHHAPALACIDTPMHRARFPANLLDVAYANSWDGVGRQGEPALLGPACELARPADLWIYGHSHVAGHLQHGHTLCVSNPRGYPGENGSTGFDPLSTFSL
ncbi:metallophosphoesterase [Thiomonas sp. FB-Cd]|uniref:metallophosphoesterase n=1 Tax=Thiomonas sp. FB-Cd TaxID=1158292 RepID=UPI00056F9BB0|nr:metallophosphoesterase [Thiomonas sp. FB-Cd]